MLSAVLGEEVEDLTILNPQVPGSLSTETVDKLVVLDIRVQLQGGKRVIVEMQVRATEELGSRLVFYAARDLSSELMRGEEYDELSPTVLIVWLGERMFSLNSEHLHRIFELRERRSGELLSDQLSVHVLQLEDFEELPAPSDESEGARAVRRWARFLMAEDEQDLDLLVSEDAGMESAVETIKTLSQDPEAVRLAEDRQASVRLYHHAIALAERKGKAEGKAEKARATLERLLIRRFGTLPGPTVERLEGATEADLDVWTERLLDAKNLDDVFRKQ
jgi:predicted transposase/invertase (TIGR01784 family)